MFKEQPTGHETETIIGPSVVVEGDFVTEGDIVVEGIICGTVKTTKNLRVGSKSKIYANVIANSALISGEIQGGVKIKEKLELTSTAKVFGDIKVGILVVAAGSILNGKCQMGEGKTKSAKPDFSKQGKIDLKTETSETETENKKTADKTKKK